MRPPTGPTPPLCTCPVFGAHYTTVQVRDEDVIVTLDKRAHNPYLVASGLADHKTPMPWFGNKPLSIRFD